MVAKIILSLLKHVDARVVTEAVETTVKCAKAPVSDAIVQMGKRSSSDLLHFTGKSLRARLAPVIDGYNSTKLATSRKFKTSEVILDNWDDAFGFADKSGVYRNAINRLNASGAIDDYILARAPQLKGTDDFVRIKKVLNEYLEHNLDIYSYPRIEKILRDFNPEIVEKLRKGAVIYVHDDKKSYGIIAEIYKTINPDAKVITGWKNLKDFAATQKNLNVIMLDDCLVSGDSARKVFESIVGKNGCPNVNNVDLYLLTAFDEGLAKLPKELKVKYAGELKHKLRNSSYFRDVLPDKDKGLLMSILGTGNPKFNAYSAIMFEYMAPNNNSRFASDMIKHLFSGPECAIKGVFQDILANEKVSEYIMDNLSRAQKIG